MKPVKKISWMGVEDFCQKLANELVGSGVVDNLTGIWGPPRGGLPLAVMMSHLLEKRTSKKLSVLDKPIPGCLIVDDIADTGATLQPLVDDSNEYYIATVYYKDHCTYEPDFWQHEKTDFWIEFPWEMGNIDQPEGM